MTALSTVSTIEDSLCRFTVEDVLGLLTGIADHVTNAEVRGRALVLSQRLGVLLVDAGDLMRLTPAPVHDEQPTFKLVGVGDGQPSGFRCSGCGEEWHVQPGQDASDLIPVLRQHAAQGTREETGA